MQRWRALGAVGRALMRTGVVVLLFVVYQLWGTGLLTARAQDRLADDFQVLLEQAPPSTLASGAAPETAPQTAPTDVAPPAPGEPIGVITIPDIDVDFVITQGVELKYLKEGPGHFPQTPLPGQPGNSALAGHRTTYDAPFHRIDELAPGAEITVQTVQGTFTYRVEPHETANGGVEGHFIVKPSAVEILDQEGPNRLTLMACHPKYSAAQRIVVTATLEQEPAPPTPIPAPGEGGVTFDASDDPLAGGDASAWPAAISWSLAAAAVWFLTWLAGQALRRRQDSRWTWSLPPYVVGLPIFLVVLFVAFQEIARLLPAAY